MEKYIIITEFGEQQDIRVGLKSCKNKYNLLLCWAKHLSYPLIPQHYSLTLFISA